MTQTNARGPLPRGLVALNAVLLLALVGVSVGPTATAQSQSQNRSRGAYTMVGGEIRPGNSNGVYVLDSANQEVLLLRYDDGRDRLEGLAYRDLQADSSAMPGR